MTIAALKLRISDGQVIASVFCPRCEGFGRVVRGSGYTSSAAIDPPSGEEVDCTECDGSGRTDLESSAPDFESRWNETLYMLTEAERAEANALLVFAEEKAMDDYLRSRA